MVEDATEGKGCEGLGSPGLDVARFSARPPLLAFLGEIGWATLVICLSSCAGLGIKLEAGLGAGMGNMPAAEETGVGWGKPRRFQPDWHSSSDQYVFNHSSHNNSLREPAPGLCKQASNHACFNLKLGANVSDIKQHLIPTEHGRWSSKTSV